jgi:translation initiation factor 1
MSRSEKTKIATDGGAVLGQNPFGAALGGLAGLSALGNLPAVPQAPAGEKKTAGGGAGGLGEKEKNRGRVDVLRTTAGRGGKTVTVARNFTGIGLPEKEALCKKMRSAAGCGGTVKDGEIEIQGDQRETVARVLREAGFRPVMAGG